MSTCKECIHYDVCKVHVIEGVGIDFTTFEKMIEKNGCEQFKDRAKCVDIPGTMSVADLADAYEGIGNTLLNVAKRLRGEQADE